MPIFETVFLHLCNFDNGPEIQFELLLLVLFFKDPFSCLLFSLHLFVCFTSFRYLHAFLAFFLASAFLLDFCSFLFCKVFAFSPASIGFLHGSPWCIATYFNFLPVSCEVLSFSYGIFFLYTVFKIFIILCLGFISVSCFSCCRSGVAAFALDKRKLDLPSPTTTTAFVYFWFCLLVLLLLLFFFFFFFFLTLLLFLFFLLFFFFFFLFLFLLVLAVAGQCSSF